MKMKKLLLHVCCGPCSTHSIETLQKDYDVTLFYSNSNIFPEEEYKKRLENARIISKIYNLGLIEDKYDHKSWLNHIQGLESEPEGGRRCLKCFEFNLGRAAEHAKNNNFELFTTTLTISPHKDNRAIFEIGKRLDKERFLEVDFKKKDGFSHSTELSRKLDLYRQSYCGCEFSMRKSKLRS